MLRMTRVAVEPPSVRRLGFAVASVLAPLAVVMVLRQPAGPTASRMGRLGLEPRSDGL